MLFCFLGLDRTADRSTPHLFKEIPPLIPVFLSFRVALLREKPQKFPSVVFNRRVWACPLRQSSYRVCLPLTNVTRWIRSLLILAFSFDRLSCSNPLRYLFLRYLYRQCNLLRLLLPIRPRNFVSKMSPRTSMIRYSPDLDAMFATVLKLSPSMISRFQP